MNRSITSRNLAGGFLGGALGILVSWYVAPMALPFGVLLGVVVGWWAEDIVQMFDALADGISEEDRRELREDVETNLRPKLDEAPEKADNIFDAWISEETERVYA